MILKFLGNLRDDACVRLRAEVIPIGKRLSAERREAGPSLINECGDKRQVRVPGYWAVRRSNK